MENNKRTFQSFQQIRREVKHEGFDTSKTLTYVQALENVKVALVPFAEKELQEEAKRKKDNIVIEKNKTYLRQRFAIMTERVMNIVAEQGIRVSGMTVDEFVSVAVSELEGHDILEMRLEMMRLRIFTFIAGIKSSLKRTGRTLSILKSLEMKSTMRCS